ncbi:hypothetical protein E2C01_061727 [Portunus trituberculatus]|uniref:Uncharacterized protein n=1 Tax=Portunus trituberculatus TaxID=210409 RepID=A0A5B7H614_PORTR|nr:hypothetical protein [Portunus trituberculatus]
MMAAVLKVIDSLNGGRYGRLNQDLHPKTLNNPTRASSGRYNGLRLPAVASSSAAAAAAVRFVT